MALWWCYSTWAQFLSGAPTFAISDLRKYRRNYCVFIVVSMTPISFNECGIASLGSRRISNLNVTRSAKNFKLTDFWYWLGLSHKIIFFIEGGPKAVLRGRRRWRSNGVLLRCTTYCCSWRFNQSHLKKALWNVHKRPKNSETFQVLSIFQVCL